MSESSFKLIVAGGRDYTDYERMIHEIDEYIASNREAMTAPTVAFVSGMSRGADKLAVRFARQYVYVLHKFPAQWWTKNGDLNIAAGFERNQQMAEFADKLLAFWNGKSKGTAHMIQCMQRLNKPVSIVRY
jgi:hypothetical protein